MRCPWGETDDEQMRRYHDEEWGRPCHDDVALFELMSLELMQPGLSWACVLHKRAAFREAFGQFDPRAVARMDDRLEELLANPGIIRNRKKVEAVLANAHAICALYDAGTTLDAYLWAFVDGAPIDSRLAGPGQIPAEASLIAAAASKQMKKDGFRFMGPSVTLSLFEAAGLVNDHLTCCDVHRELVG